jgi:hypothetical protein
LEKIDQPVSLPCHNHKSINHEFNAERGEGDDCSDSNGTTPRRPDFTSEPYANRPAPAQTGEMDIYAGKTDPSTPPTGQANQIIMEIDNKYPAQWDFKGNPHHIAKAARLRYRCPVLDPSDPKKILYYVDDYLLIGFEGANGP